MPLPPSQLEKPKSQAVIWQAPVEQLSLALGSAHGTPQKAQFASVVSDVSQPFTEFPSQLPHCAAQTGEQLPPPQEVVPCGLVHMTPQLPQLATSFVTLRQMFAQHALLRQLPFALHAAPSLARHWPVEILQPNPGAHCAFDVHVVRQAAPLHV